MSGLRSRGRLVVLQVLVISIIGTLVGRLAYLQIGQGDDYAAQAASNRMRDVAVPATRGEVYDVRGRPLIVNRSALLITVDPSLVRRLPDRGRDVLARLAPILDMQVAELIRTTTPCGAALPDGRKARALVDGCWVGSPYQPITVAAFDGASGTGREKVLLIEENQEAFPGVTVGLRAVRHYPFGRLAAHVLGYVGPIAESEVGASGFAGVQDTALIGRGGVERSYERRLRGTDGNQQLIVDKDGSVTSAALRTEPRAGEKLVLSIDAQVQALAERELRATIEAARARPYYLGGGPNKADSGSVVVMEVQTGRLLAMASYPSYDPALFTGGISTKDYNALVSEENGSPLLFRATQGAYAPASTFKVISAASAVMNGQTTFSTLTACPGTFGPTGQTNFAGIGTAAVTLRRAIVQSCDTNFYKFAYDAWVRDGGTRPVANPADPMITMALRFGLDRKTGVDLPGESPGLIPTREWRVDYWKALRKDFCAGAINPDFDRDRRARNKDSCEDGDKFRAGQATNFAIGQGETLVTPLQLATVYAAIANGGRLVTPTVAKAFLSTDGSTSELVEPVKRGRVPVTPTVLAQLRDALGGVTSEPGGTGRAAFAGLDLAVAGKTGTGEVNGKQSTSWFASFAPLDQPRVVVVGVVSQAGTGASAAAPMVRRMYEGMLGLDGRPALLPRLQSPAGLPVIREDGTIGPPAR